MSDWQKDLLLNAGIFASFYCISFTHHFFHERKAHTAEQHISALSFAAITNPAFFDALRDFVVHLFVYSGYIIPQH